ncbi:MAG: dihydrofolate reductase [Symploca sp. SIO1B1]|nr:dihydrofolate reductase [Symploca sp. SIO1B1]
MTNYVYIATSLDGFIATSNGGLDWLEEIPNPEQSDYGYAEFIKSIDAIVMGRNTFEKVLTFGQWVYVKPVFVLSNSLTKLPEDLLGKAEIIRGDLKEIITQLHQKGYQNLYIDGGRVIQSFLQEDLIDEMIITLIPILLGKGFPLFGELEQQLRFRHKATEIYNNNLVKNHYIRDK